ncbi:MAG: alkaline phosphatase family protein [Bacteroidales bacterium]|nr:alkaline phosphatase family protein [Bacteroidales bacterium]
MPRKHPLLFSLITLMALLASTEVKGSVASRQEHKALPRVVVQILVDQLRADHLESFAPLYGEGGLRLLLREGRLYSRGALPMARADRASAAATLSTGSTPSQHGIVAWQWLNRETLRPMLAIDDRGVKGLATVEQYSPRWLAVSTLGDELKLATQGRAKVVSIAAQADAAILTAGHAADEVVWIDRASGQWSSSSYYGRLPQWADQSNVYAPLERRLASTTWTPLYLPLAGTPYTDGLGEKQVFSHSFKGATRYEDFATSGLINEEIANAASAAISSSELGNDFTPDLLTLTLYAGTPQHRPAATCGHELQDTYTRLDRAVAQIIAATQAKVGVGNALFALTSTGYSIEEEEDERLARYRVPTGQFDLRRNVSLLGMYLVATYGQGNYIETTHGTDIYLNHRLLTERQLSLTEVQARVQEFLRQLSGVQAVHTGSDLLQGAWSPERDKLRAGYFHGRSADIRIELQPGWKCIDTGTRSTTTAREAFAAFPIVLYGSDVERGLVTTPVTLDRIAPTLSRAIRIRAPNACHVSPLP